MSYTAAAFLGDVVSATLPLTLRADSGEFSDLKKLDYGKCSKYRETIGTQLLPTSP